MKRTILAACACAAALGVLGSDSARGATLIAPTLSWTVDGDAMTAPSSAWTYDGTYETWEFAGWAGNMPNGDYVEVQAGGIVDPMLIYTFAPIDFGAPSTFTFNISMVIPPTPGTLVDASISGGLTDATGNGVSLTPNPLNGDPDGDSIIETQVNNVSPPPLTNMGVDVGLGVAFGPGPAGANYTYGPYADGPQPGPAGVFTQISIRTSFQLSGGNDAASLTGFAQIVPEPSSIAMLALGGLALARRSRRVA